MTNQSTIDKLIEMRLTTMADAFRNQLADPKFREVPFEDRFGMLVDIEYSNRKNNRLKRLIHNAGFDQDVYKRQHLYYAFCIIQDLCRILLIPPKYLWSDLV